MNIYVVKIEDITEDGINNLMIKITKDKREKINKFINKKDKLRALISEILLRTILAKHFGISNENVVISKNEYGKPFLEGYKEVNFNISHSGDYVVCAIDNKEIGIDIEQISDIDYREIAERFFPKNDIEFILNNNDGKELDRFYEIWTLKESYIKAEGKGLTIPLNSFCFDFNENDIKVDKDIKGYRLKRFNIFQGYKMAVCSLSERIIEEVLEINQEKLIDEYYKL